jgi:hypothetical protein
MWRILRQSRNRRNYRLIYVQIRNTEYQIKIKMKHLQQEQGAIYVEFEQVQEIAVEQSMKVSK